MSSSRAGYCVLIAPKTSARRLPGNRRLGFAVWTTRVQGSQQQTGTKVEQGQIKHNYGDCTGSAALVVVVVVAVVGGGAAAAFPDRHRRMHPVHCMHACLHPDDVSTPTRLIARGWGLVRDYCHIPHPPWVPSICTTPMVRASAVVGSPPRTNSPPPLALVCSVHSPLFDATGCSGCPVGGRQAVVWILLADGS
jgi:hypothetical protein